MAIRYASQKTAVAAEGQRPQAPAAALGGLQSAEIGEAARALPGRLARRLVRRIIPMTLAAALPLAGAFALIKLSAEQFRSTASVFVDPGQGRSGPADGVADTTVMAMNARLATSRAILESAMTREKLAEDSSVFVKPTGSAALLNIALAVMGKGPAGPAEDRKSAVLRLMSEQIRAQPADKANLIEISAVASHAGTAARLANAVADALVDNLVTTRDSAEGSELARQSARKLALRTRLDEVEAKLAAYRQKNGLPAAGRAGQPGEGDLAGQLARARAATIDIRSRGEQIQKLLGTGKDIEAIADLVRSPAIDRLRIQYTEAAAQEASLRSSLGPRHPSYLEAAEQARERKQLLWEGFRLAATTARADLQTAQEQERALEQRLGPDAAAAVAAAAPPAQLRELEREVETARAAYDRAVRSGESAEATPGTEVARVVVRAAPAAQPLSEPQGAIWSAGIAGAAGLALMVFAFGGRRTRHKTPGFQFRSLIDSVTSAAIPVRAATMPGPAPVTARPVATRAPIRFTPTAQPPVSGSPVQPVAQDAAATQPDAIARLAHELTVRDSDFPVQVVLVTGAAPAEDRAQLALSFGRTAAKLGLRVLLIEADEAETGLTRRVGASPVAATLTLNDRPRLVLALTGTPEPTIWAVPSEADRPVPANDGGMVHLPGLAGRFDLVVLSGPHLNALLACRKLARTAQTVVLAEMPGTPCDPELEARDLGIDPQHLRIIQTRGGTGPDPAAPPPARRPMSIIRRTKCA